MRITAFFVGIVALGVCRDALCEGLVKRPPLPVAFSRLAASPVLDQESIVEGCVVDAYQCPSCPPKTACKPCAAPSVTVRQLAPQPSVDEIVVHARSSSGFDAAGGVAGGRKEWPRVGHRVQMTVRVRPPQAGQAPVIGLEAASFKDLGVCRPPPPVVLWGGAEILWDAPPGATASPGSAQQRGTFSRVQVTTTPSAPPAGTYLLLDTKGPVARLALESARDHAGSCPYSARFAVEGSLRRSPGAGDHLVVVGPVQDARASGRLLFRGLATAGHPASLAVDPLGVRAPGGAEPLYAVDLDGDRVADLATTWSRKFGSVKSSTLDRKEIAESFHRKDHQWSMAAHCSWHETDHVGP